MRVSRPLVASALCAVIALSLTAGCGSSGKPVDVGALKVQLGGVADRVDRCVAKTNDARKCATADAIGGLPAGAELGRGDGQISIDAPAALRYELTAQVNSKVTFAIKAEPVGARSRRCSPAGTGACPKTGSW